MTPAAAAAFSAAPTYFQRALKHDGLRELLPDGSLNPIVRGWLRDHTRFPERLINPKTKWCAAFWCAMLEESGLASPHSAAATAFMKYGEECSPELGSLVVIRTGKAYHVTCWAGAAGPKFLGFGGNQRNSVCMQFYDSLRIVSCRRPISP